jgi:ribosomal protein S18 acetylase RimI-like enzyme
MVFYKNLLNFRLSTPEYELPVFGYRVGELRLIEEAINEEAKPISELINYLKSNEIKTCTFRGPEEINAIRLIENIGFRFVSTYNQVECKIEEFKEIKTQTNYETNIADSQEFEEILQIEKLVNDFSTFSIDPLIDSCIASQRNMIRVKSHFKKENHRIYIVKINGKIAGFIQFVLDVSNKIAHTLNAAIHPDYQKANIGKTLFSNSFKAIFNEGCNIITSDYSIQNIGSAKLHTMCNFRIVKQELHFRYFNF